MSKHEEIQKLDQKLTELTEQYNKLDEESEATAQKRDKLNNKFKETRNEISKLKAERDEINEKVKALKQQRNELRSAMIEKINEAKTLRPQIATLNNKKPDESMEALKKQVEDIDWKIQTSSLSSEEEKQLVNRVKELETQLIVHKKLEALRQKNLKLQAEISTLKTRENNRHESLTASAQKSQELHQKMIAKIEESKKVKTEADDTHQAFLEIRNKAKSVNDEITVATLQTRGLKGTIKEEARKEQAIKTSALREELIKEAKEKLQRGEKLTLEEFQLLLTT